MAVKHPIGSVAGSYAKLQESLPGLEIDPRTYGPQAIDLLAEMAKTGPVFRQVSAYLIEHDIPLYVVREAKGVGAGWHEDILHRRWISVDLSFSFLDRLLGIGHETLHLQQSIRTRCSVEGEYHAWRFYYTMRAELASGGTSIPLSDDEKRLAAMPETPSREDLKAAQQLMHKMAGPDYPILRAPLQGKDWLTALLGAGLRVVNTFIKRGELL
jgi:hypothetical protein